MGWMATWGGPCDCGACPPTGIAFSNGGADMCEPCEQFDQPVQSDAQYKFESWVSTDAERIVVVGYLPLFDDEPFCRHHAEPLLLAGSDFIALGKGEGGKVYVHCERGCSRSAAVLTCYLMKYEGMSLLEAAVSLKARRVRVSPNGALVDVLARIEKQSASSPSDIDAVNAAFKRPWLPDYRA